MHVSNCCWVVDPKWKLNFGFVNWWLHIQERVTISAAVLKIHIPFSDGCTYTSPSPSTMWSISNLYEHVGSRYCPTVCYLYEQTNVENLIWFLGDPLECICVKHYILMHLFVGAEPQLMVFIDAITDVISCKEFTKSIQNFNICFKCWLMNGFSQGGMRALTSSSKTNSTDVELITE